jgi:hypothetical protein
MTGADPLLTRLEGVRAVGRDRWRAACPLTRGHKSGTRNRALSVRLADGGAVLLHCFAGHSAAEIVAAVGLALDDLFPPRADGVHRSKPRRPMFDWPGFVRYFETDLLIVLVVLRDVVDRQSVIESDLVAAGAAAARINRALIEARRAT